MRVYVTKKDIMKGDRGSAVSCPRRIDPVADWLLRERGLVAVANTVQELVQAISFSRDGKVAVKVLPREGLGEQWVARAFPTFTGPSSLRYGPQIAGETSWLRRVRDAEEARVAEKGKG